MAELTRGELLRYLAKLAWAPGAIGQNPELTWQELAPNRLAVTAGSVTIFLDFDAEGRIAGGFAPARSRLVGDKMLPTPWRGAFSDYRRVDGRWIPFRGEVGWILDGAYWPYWRGKIVHWEIAAGSM